MPSTPTIETTPVPASDRRGRGRQPEPRTGKCKVCDKPAEDCANCMGSGKKKRDGAPCAACKGVGKKAFCGRECREKSAA